MAVETNQKFVNIEQFGLFGTAVKSITDQLNTNGAQTFKDIVINGNTIEFYTENHTNAGATPAQTFDFPKELFLDQANTSFVANFTWSSTTYPGSTDPDLNGKPVIVFAVKGTTDPARTTANETEYKFIDVSFLVDTYTVNEDTVSTNTLDINSTNNKVSFKVNGDESNAIEVTETGLKVVTENKADFAVPTNSDNIAVLDASGNNVDSQIAKSTILTTDYISSVSEANTILTTNAGITISS